MSYEEDMDRTTQLLGCSVAIESLRQAENALRFVNSRDLLDQVALLIEGVWTHKATLDVQI